MSKYKQKFCQPSIFSMTVVEKENTLIIAKLEWDAHHRQSTKRLQRQK